MEPENIVEVSEDEAFCFDCHSGVRCFNECCGDLNQFLTPYDILRLKKYFSMSSTRFLDIYTTRHMGPQTGLPVITLKPADPSILKCPFVTSSGCSVYTDRPSSCRMYPVIRVLSRSRETGKTKIRYALLKEPHCRGFEEKRRITVREWMENQGLLPYNEMNDMMMDIISLKNRLMPGPLMGEAEQLFFTLCYDIDRLKEATFKTEHHVIEISDAVKSNDADLLRFGMAYLRDKVFGQKDG